MIFTVATGAIIQIAGEFECGGDHGLPSMADLMVCIKNAGALKLKVTSLVCSCFNSSANRSNKKPRQVARAGF
jgi:hypothetical protein